MNIPVSFGFFGLVMIHSRATKSVEHQKQQILVDQDWYSHFNVLNVCVLYSCKRLFDINYAGRFILCIIIFDDSTKHTKGIDATRDECGRIDRPYRPVHISLRAILKMP